MCPDEKPLCCLVVGHRPGAGGAVSVGGVSEYDFNAALARDIAAATFGVEVRIVHRDDDAGGYNRLPGQINAIEPDFVVSMHFNSFSDPDASGSEVLHWPGSSGGYRLAQTLLTEFVEALGLPNRGAKTRGSGRGSTLLGGTVAPCVIAEPFFGSNPGDWRAATEKRDLLATGYKRALEEYAEGL